MKNCVVFFQDETPPNPYVSVIIPAYNCERFIATTVDSVLQQSFKDFELIIVNDGSTDHTSRILRRLQKKDSRIKVFDHKKNQGVAKTRNEAFGYCKGTFIALLDADDIWYEDKLQEQVEEQKRTGADLIYCSYSIINETGERICDDFIVPRETDLQATLVQSVINCSTAFFKSSLTSRFHFRSEYFHEDLVFWIDLLQAGITVRGVQKILAAYRVVRGSRAADKFKSARNRYVILRRYLNLPMLQAQKIMMQYVIKALNKYRGNVKKNECVDYQP